MNFVVAAATSADMVHHRRDLQHYGPDSYDWSPYRPELEQRICVFAQNIAASQDLTSGLARADEIEELLDQANDANELVVLLTSGRPSSTTTASRCPGTTAGTNRPAR